MAFSTVFQAFLTTFLIDSGYKTPIQNKDEMFASGIKSDFYTDISLIFEIADETEWSKIQRNVVRCPSYDVCVEWASYQKNVSIFLSDMEAEILSASGSLFGENSEPLLCKLEDGIFYNSGLIMVMFHGDPLIRRVTEIIDRVVEAGLYNYWISFRLESLKLFSRKIAIVQQLDGYYSFNLYHMQPAFYLAVMGWCISALSFIVELLYNRVLQRSK
jgi:hypothetical protein